jgi:gliding motility-associated-like protein
MKCFRSILLTIIFLLAGLTAFSQGGSIIRKASTSVMDPNGDGFISGVPPSINTPFSSDGYYVDEFEIPMFGLPKILNGDVPGDNIGNQCGITDLIPDSLNGVKLGYSVYAKHLANNKLMFRFRTGDDNSSVESWTILIDTDGRFGNTGPNADPDYTNENPGFELDITLIKRNNAGVYVYNVDGIDNCPTELLFYPITSHFQISLDGTSSCGNPDYYYDYYVPFDSVASAFNSSNGNKYSLSTSTSLRYAAATNTSASCAMGGTLSDVSGVDNTDPAYDGCFTCAFTDIIESQCGTPVDSLVADASGFDSEKVSKPDIDGILKKGQMVISGTTIEPDIFVILKIYTNLGTATNKFWSQDPGQARETHQAYANGTQWSFNLNGPLQAYDSIVAKTQLTEFSVPCGGSNNTSSSTSSKVADNNNPPVAIVQNLTTTEDTALPIILKGKDPDGDEIAFSILVSPKHGTLLNAGTDSTWTYTPFANYFGPDTLSFNVAEITQAHLDSANFVYITVTPVNDAPVISGSAGPAVYTSVQSSIIIDNSINVTDEDDVNMESATVSISGNFVSGEDVLVFTNTLKITGTYTNGILTLIGTATNAEYAAALASVKYANVSNRPTTTTRTVSFVVNDGSVNSAPYAVSIQFNINNFPPDIQGDSNGELHFTTPEDVPLTNQCLTVSDPESQTVSITSVTSLTSHGTTVSNGLCFTYTPTPNFFGEERVRIIVCDNGVPSGCDTVVVVITVTSVNDAPVTVGDIFSTTEDTPITFNILTNDSDIDNAIDPATAIITPASIAGQGSFVYNGSGSVTFTPVSDFFGTVTTNYTVKDVSGATSNNSTITVTVFPVNDLPVATDDVFITNEDVTLSSENILTNDTDADNALTVTQFVVPGDVTNYTAGSMASIPGIGTIVINDNGTFTFVPATNYNNNAPVLIATYTVTDGTANDDATLSIRVNPVNDDPVGGNDSGATNNLFTTLEDDPITLAENANILDNDVDPDGDVLSVTQFIVNATTHTITAGGSASAVLTGIGTVTIHSNGDLEYAPFTSFNGNVPLITYSNSDGKGGVGTATVSIIVTPMNDLPVANDDMFTTAEDATLSTENVLANDTDVESTLTVTKFVVPGDVTNYNPGNTANIPGIGTIVINANGSFTFTPAANYNNNAPALIATYTASDGTTTDNATLSIEVTPVNDNPVGGNDSGASNNVFTTLEDNPITLSDNANVLDNDTDPDGDVLSVTQFIVNNITIAIAPGNSGSTTLSGIGTVTIHSNGDLEFTPVLNFNGALPTIAYSTSDGNGGVGSATTSIVVTPVNDNPVAVDDTKQVLENAVSLTGNVLANDEDVDGNALTVTQFNVAGDGTTYSPGSTAIIAGIGSIVINSNGSYTFIPVANYDGPVPDITYTVGDGNGGTDTAVLTITVVNVIDYPIAGDDFFSTPEDTQLNGVNVLTNDETEVGNTLSVTEFTIAGDVTLYAAGATAAISNIGSVRINADGGLVFNPASNYHASVPHITYTITDGSGSASATVVITINSVNDPVVAINDSFITAEDITLSNENVLANDSDVDQNVLTVTTFTVPGDLTQYNADQTATVTGIGTIKINTNGSFTFDPDPNYNNNSAVLIATYTVSDGTVATTATLSIEVTPVNDVPVVGNDTGADAFTTLEDDPITLAENKNVLDNDVDPDGDILSVTEFTVNSGTHVIAPGSSGSASLAAIGTITIHSNGDVEFAPVVNFNGNVPPVTYITSDGQLGTAIGTLNIIVTPVNDPVIAADDAYTIDEDFTLNSENVLANDSDIDLDVLSVSQFTVPGDLTIYNAGQTAILSGIGTIKINSDGGFTFDPDINYNNNGPVLVANYTVTDGLLTDIATLSITVTPVNDNPVVGNETGADAFSTAEEDPITLAENANVLGNDIDPDGDPILVTEFKVGSDTHVVAPGSSATVTLSGIGMITLHSNGDLEFVPENNFYGTVPTITYITGDGQSGSANGALSIVVTPVNDATAATDDTFTTIEDVTLNTKNVLDNDTDVDQDALSVTTFVVSGSATVYNAGQTAALPGIGTLVIDSDGSFTFDPDLNYSSNLAILVAIYTVSDGTGTVEANLSIQVTPVNDDPTGGDDTGTGASNDPFTALEDTPIILSDNANVLTNDTDPEGDNLTVIDFTVDGNTFTISSGGSASASISNVGTVTIHNDGRLEFSPVLNYTGAVPAITYTMSDGQGGSGTATVNIIVTPVNDAPVFVGGSTQTFTTQEDTDLPFCLAVQDVEGNAISIDNKVHISGDGSLLPTVSVSGTSVCFQFDPALNFNSGANSSNPSVWQLSVCDNAATPGCATVSLSIIVTPVNDAPVTADDGASTDEDVPVTIDVLQNDSDVDTALDPNNKINPGTIDLNPITPEEEKTFTVANQGTFTANALGTVTFTPYLDFGGPTASASYTVKDFGGLSSASATITVNVTPINDAPVIEPFDYMPPDYYIYEDSVFGPVNNEEGICISVTDSEGDPITYDPNPMMIKGGGTMMIRTDNFNYCYIFTPAPNYNGESIWEFSVDDGTATSSAQIKIVVLPVNDPPVAAHDFVEAKAASTLTIDAITNDLTIASPYEEFYDIYAIDSADVLEVTKVESLGPGVAIIQDNKILYTSQLDYVDQSDSVRYWIKDSGGLIDSAVVFIDVGPASFHIYEGLSPNGDTKNDFWRIDGIEQDPSSRVRVFDRFNNLVFETRGYSNTDNFWAGQSNHGISKASLPEGTYYYTITIDLTEDNEGERVFKGFVILKRD